MDFEKFESYFLDENYIPKKFLDIQSDLNIETDELSLALLELERNGLVFKSKYSPY